VMPKVKALANDRVEVLIEEVDADTAGELATSGAALTWVVVVEDLLDVEVDFLLIEVGVDFEVVEVDLVEVVEVDLEVDLEVDVDFAEDEEDDWVKKEPGEGLTGESDGGGGGGGAGACAVTVWV